MPHAHMHKHVYLGATLNQISCLTPPPEIGEKRITGKNQNNNRELSQFGAPFLSFSSLFFPPIWGTLLFLRFDSPVLRILCRRYYRSHMATGPLSFYWGR